MFKDYIMIVSIMEDNIWRLRNIEKIIKYVYFFLYKDYEMNLLEIYFDVIIVINGIIVVFIVLYNVFEMMWCLLFRNNCCWLIYCC